MKPNPFAVPSLAVAFFASAGGAALLSACLDMRAALANLDEGNDDDDATAAKERFDDLTDMLAEAGVPVVIAPGASGDDFDADPAAYDAKNAAMKPNGDPLREEQGAGGPVTRC